MTYGYRQRLDAEVMALGAWCDLVPRETSTASPGGTSFEVHEFAIMNDGRRLTLHTSRGFTSWVQASYPAGQKPSVEPDPCAVVPEVRRRFAQIPCAGDQVYRFVTGSIPPTLSRLPDVERDPTD